MKFLANMDEFNACMSEAGDKAVVIDFTATWCPPCQRIGPVFEAMSGEAEFASVVTCKVDVDAASDVSGHVGIRCMPTFIVFKGGKEVERMEGASDAGLRAILTKYK